MARLPLLLALPLAVIVALSRPAHACFVVPSLPGIEVEMQGTLAYDAGMICTLVGIKVGAKTYPDLATATPAGLARLGWADPAKRKDLATSWVMAVFVPVLGDPLVTKAEAGFAKVFAPLVVETVKDETRARFWVDATKFGGMQPTTDFTYVEIELTFAASGALTEKRLRRFEDPIALPASACSAKPFPDIEVRGRFVRDLGCTVDTVVIGGKRFRDHDAALKAGLARLGWKTATAERRKQIAMQWFEEITGRFERFHLVRTAPTWFGSEAFHPATIEEAAGKITLSAWVDATRADRVHSEIQRTYRDLVLEIDANGVVKRTMLREALV
ncbi:MAG: hypothetical protein ABI678_13815 [Kofleriaceae bacterium]